MKYRCRMASYTSEYRRRKARQLWRLMAAGDSAAARSLHRRGCALAGIAKAEAGYGMPIAERLKLARAASLASRKRRKAEAVRDDELRRYGLR
jgi:hypothetical protein